MPADKMGARIIHFEWMRWVALLYINLGCGWSEGWGWGWGHIIHLFGWVNFSPPTFELGEVRVILLFFTMLSGYLLM